MKKKYLILLSTILVLTFILSSCMPGPRVIGTPGVALSDDTAVVAYGTYVFGVDVENGTAVWHFPEKANTQIVFYARPLVTEDAVYVGDLGNNFHKLNLETGIEEWIFTGANGYFIGQAALDGEMIYAPSNDGNLYALDKNGNLVWQFKTGHYIWAQPQVTTDAVFIGSMDHSVYALSKDGEELWSYKMGGAVVGAPILSEDGSTLFVGSMGKEMIALDTSSGDVLWTYDANGSLESVWGIPLLNSGSLIFSDSSGQIFALDTQSGEPSWQTQVTGSIVGGLTAIEDGFVLGTKEGLLKAFDFEGSPKWEATLEGEIFDAPAVNDEFVVVGTINGKNLLYAFNMSGVQLWSTTPKN